MRALGCELGLDPAFVGRHPFPGPGLAIRISRRGDAGEGLGAAEGRPDLAGRNPQGRSLRHDLAGLRPCSCRFKTVGVMGDARTLRGRCAPSAPVTSTDGMTADFFEFPWKVLGPRPPLRIVNEVKGINRVVYDVTRPSLRALSNGSSDKGGVDERGVASSLRAGLRPAAAPRVRADRRTTRLRFAPASSTWVSAASIARTWPATTHDLMEIQPDACSLGHHRRRLCYPLTSGSRDALDAARRALHPG